MQRQKLSLREAARRGRIAISTLAFVLDSARLQDPDRCPKRGMSRGTMMVLRDMPWIGMLAVTMLDRLIAVKARAGSGIEARRRSIISAVLVDGTARRDVRGVLSEERAEKVAGAAKKFHCP